MTALSRWIVTVKVDGTATRMTTNATSKAEAAANVRAYFDADESGDITIVSVERDRSFRRPRPR